MAEYPESELIERRKVDPPTEPDERGWVAVSATQAVWREVTLIDDVNGAPYGVTAETVVADAVHYVPPGSIRLERLAFERANGITYDDEGNVDARR